MKFCERYTSIQRFLDFREFQVLDFFLLEMSNTQIVSVPVDPGFRDRVSQFGLVWVFSVLRIKSRASHVVGRQCLLRSHTPQPQISLVY